MSEKEHPAERFRALDKCTRDLVDMHSWMKEGEMLAQKLEAGEITVEEFEERYHPLLAESIDHVESLDQLPDCPPDTPDLGQGVKKPYLGS